jgi:hypothetical protein
VRARFEDVREGPPDLDGRQRVGITGDAAVLQNVVAADIVQAHNVVGVTVREENRVHARQTEAQRLPAKVGGGVDEYRQIRQLDIDGWPHAVVARVVGRAHTAGAADHRHAV